MLISPNMEKKTALITGGAKRIGCSIAELLASKGYDIAIHYNHSKEDAEKLCGQLNEKGITAKSYGCDLEDMTAVSNLIKEALNDFSSIDLLINNASVFEKDSIREINLDRIQQNLNVHYIAPYILISEFAKITQKGHVINILDRHVDKGHTAFASYLISKKALKGLTDVAAAELAPDIRVNAIAPGFILDPEKQDQIDLEQRINKIPFKRKGAPIDIANTVAFLEETPYITGQTLFVDGGESL